MSNFLSALPQAAPAARFVCSFAISPLVILYFPKSAPSPLIQFNSLFAFEIENCLLVLIFEFVIFFPTKLVAEAYF